MIDEMGRIIDDEFEAKIERIMGEFNFDLVRKAIKILNLPYEVDLESQARKLLERVAAEPDWGWIGVDIGCGLTAEKLPGGDLILHFALELQMTGV